MLVGQVGEHGNVLGLGFCQLGRSQAHHAGEDEEHHEAQQYDGGALQDGVGLGDGVVTVITALGQGEAGDGRAVVEGEHQHRDGQPQGGGEILGGRHLGQGGTCPVRDQVEGDARQDGDERVHQELGDLQHQLLTGQHDRHHGHDQHDGEDPARRRRHLQLVDQEALDGIGDAHAVDQHYGVDGEEVEQGD
ncbi:hypothetical protein D3C75_763920 [compost metagenome]